MAKADCIEGEPGALELCQGKARAAKLNESSTRKIQPTVHTMAVRM